MLRDCSYFCHLVTSVILSNYDQNQQIWGLAVEISTLFVLIKLFYNCPVLKNCPLKPIFEITTALLLHFVILEQKVVIIRPKVALMQSNLQLQIYTDVMNVS